MLHTGKVLIFPIYAFYVRLQMSAPILLWEDVFADSELILPFLFLSINSSSIKDGLHESGLAWSGGGIGSDEIASTVWLEVLLWESRGDSKRGPNLFTPGPNNSPIELK